MQINSIAQFFGLPEDIQADILQRLNTKVRLDMFLEALSEKESVAKEVEEKEYICPCCKGKGSCKKEVRDNSGLHASQIHLCPKKLWLDLQGHGNTYKQKPNPKLMRIFAHGTKLHDMLQEWGRAGAWGKTYQDEVKLLPTQEDADKQKTQFFELGGKYGVRSSVDAVIWNYEVEDVKELGNITIKVVHEYKSISERAYGKLEGPKAVHKMQANLYAAILDAPVIVYLYYDKANDDIADFPTRFDPHIWTMVEQKSSLVKYRSDNNIEVPWEETAMVYNKEECVGGQYQSPCQYFGKVCFPPDLIEVKKVRKRKPKND